MSRFINPLSYVFNQGAPSPAIPGVNAPVDAVVDMTAAQPEMGQVGQVIGEGGAGTEGLSGLLDPVATLDRQRAAHELRAKFDVVGDDHPQERLPNQVSAAEYEKIVHTYSDIRLGRSDLKMDAWRADDPNAYRANVMDDIGDIMQTRSGRSLIEQLSNNVKTDEGGAEVHRRTTLQPRFVKTPEGLTIHDPTTNTRVLDTTGATETGNSSPGMGAPFEDGRAGVGSDTCITYNANHDVVATSGATYRSDVALFHEMVHALHDTRGTTDMEKVSPLDGVRRDLAEGNPLDSSVTPDPALVADAGKTRRYEHQAVGLGLYRNAPITENAYRRERRDVALSGMGMAGDLLMEQRDRYRGSRASYNSFFGL